MISLPDLAEKIQDAGLMHKPFFECTRGEIELLCSAVLSSFDATVPRDGWSKPRLDGKYLIIPFDSHPDYHWWKEGGKCISETLVELDAPYSVAKNYLYRLTEAEWLNKLIPF